MGEPPKESYVQQYVATFSGTLIIFSVIAAYGWTSPTLPLLLDKDRTHLPITADQSSWIVSLMVFGMIFGPIPTSWLVDKIGRKRTMLIAAVPLIVGWIMILTATSIGVMYGARFLCGISYGMAYSSVPLYLGEIASDKVRGAIGTSLTVMAKLAILFEYAIGPYVSFNVLAGVSMVPPILFLLIFVWMPESPYFLIDNRQTYDALESLKRLRGHNNVEQEFEKMKGAISLARQNKGSFKDLFQRGNLRSLIIILGLGAAQQLCGSQAMIAYSQQIFDQVNTSLGASESAIIMAVVQLLTSIFSSSIVDRMGRRPLLLISTIGVTICNTIIGIYFFLVYLELDVSSIGALPLVTIMVFITSYTIGLATVPFAILGEIFPTNVKANAAAIYTMFASVIGFAVTKLYQVVADNLGTFVSFWGFALFSAVFVVFVWQLVVETKGKPLDVILEEMNRPSKKALK